MLSCCCRVSVALVAIAFSLMPFFLLTNALQKEGNNEVRISYFSNGATISVIDFQFISKFPGPLTRWDSLPAMMHASASIPLLFCSKCISRCIRRVRKRGREKERQKEEKEREKERKKEREKERENKRIQSIM